MSYVVKGHDMPESCKSCKFRLDVNHFGWSPYTACIITGRTITDSVYREVRDKECPMCGLQEYKSVYGYDIHNLYLFSIACREKGVTNDELKDFVSNFEEVVEMVKESFDRSMKECLKRALQKEDDDE